MHTAAERRDKLVPYAQMSIIISHNQLPRFRSLFGLQFSKKPENKPHEQLSYGVLILFALRLRRFIINGVLFVHFYLYFVFI